jgi:hypothetical protein
MQNYTTFNGGNVKIGKVPVPVFPRSAFIDGTGVDTSCPFCLHSENDECAIFTQFGITSDMYDILLWCKRCDRPFVIETETPA